MRNIFLLLFIFCISVANAQNRRTVNGRTVNQDGAPVIYATIQVAGVLSRQVLSSEDGSFALEVSNGDILEVSSVGYSSAKAIIKPDSSYYLIRLQSNNTEMGEVVVTGFQKQRKLTVTGAISTVTGTELAQSPSASFQNALVGRMPGIFQQQVTGQPGKDAANIFIRGISTYATTGGINQPLVIVDNMEFDYSKLSQIDVNEIESFSILKDAASTAVYGIRGANGVIVITTKRGKESKPVINVTINNGVQTPTILRKPLGAADGLMLIREQLIQQGKNPDTEEGGLYTQASIDSFRYSSNRYKYPSVNWYDELIRKYAMQNNQNIDMSGGNQIMRYFFTLSHWFQDGVLAEVPKSESFNSNYYLRRFNLRTNLDFTVTKTLTVKTDLRANFSEINEPNLPDVMTGGAWPMWRRITSGVLTPWLYPVKNPDGSYAGKIGNYSLNPVGILEYAGYSREFNNDFNINISANQKLGFITNGLEISGAYSFAQNTGFTRTLTRGRFPTYVYNDDGSYTPVFSDLTRLTQLSRAAGYLRPVRKTNKQLQLSYNRTFGSLHNVSANVVAMEVMNRIINATSGQPNRTEVYKGINGQFVYTYDNKYILGYTASYSGTDKFKSGKKFGYFPAYSAGWVLSEENFFKDKVGFVNFFKIRGSYGTTGTDNIAATDYLYVDRYARSTNTYLFGEVPSGIATISPASIANETITWEKKRSYNIGVDLKLFNNSVDIVVDRFDDLRYDILSTRATVPTFAQIELTPTNLGRVSNKGWEFEVKYKNTIGQDLSYFIGGNLSIAKNTILFRDEPYNFRNPLNMTTGNPVGQIFGYRSLGFFQTQEEINNGPTDFRTGLKPGDLKYEDVNGDGVINDQDIVPIGLPGVPPYTFGCSAGFSYKGFDLSVLFQGASGSNLAANTMLQIGNVNGTPMEIHLQRWTPETAATAEMPRLGGPNFDNSSFWLRDASYLRLKNFETGYTFGTSFLKSVGIKSFRIFANGQNLITWYKLKIYDVDPESQNDNATAAYTNYPQMKVINLGLRATF
ncbi:SusC/RagA family TonB-linked outer membrane protein [Niabella aquatica]